MEKITISTPDVSLAGSVLGETPHFLLLHAGGESRRVWRPVQDRLARAGLDSVAFDQRGHGESTGSRREPIESFSSDLKHMLQAFAGTRIVVGASLGGLAAILALQDQELQANLSGLVLVDVVPAPDPARVRRFLGDTAPHLADTFLVDDILGKGAALLKAAEAIRIPVLLIRAGQSGPMTNEEVRRFRAVCPQLRVEHVDLAGHLIAQDAPLQLADILLRFDQSVYSG